MIKEKKYFKIINKDFKIIKNRKLFRIQAIKDFEILIENKKFNFKKIFKIKNGELGGYIEFEKNLIQGNSWVYKNSFIIGEIILNNSVLNSKVKLINLSQNLDSGESNLESCYTHFTNTYFSGEIKIIYLSCQDKISDSILIGYLNLELDCTLISNSYLKGKIKITDLHGSQIKNSSILGNLRIQDCNFNEVKMNLDGNLLDSTFSESILKGKKIFHQYIFLKIL